MRFEERVIACFQGLATGDAIGKQTETLSHSDVRKWYPKGITGFHGRPGDVIPRYAGKRYEWRIGETTDDTEQTLAVMRGLLLAGEARHDFIGRELLRCRKSVHPGVQIWRFHESGDPARIATDGDGCGVAMRVAPVGVAYPPDGLEALARAAYECAIPTHGGPLAIGAAAAVAAAVSAALDGRAREDVLAAALKASQLAESIPVCIQRIYSDLDRRGRLSADEIAEKYFPNRPEHIVPLAITLALLTGSAEQTALIAANVGGDSDSVASIGGAIAGALWPESVNQQWWSIVSWLEGEEIAERARLLAARWPRP